MLTIRLELLVVPVHRRLANRKANSRPLLSASGGAVPASLNRGTVESEALQMKPKAAVAAENEPCFSSRTTVDAFQVLLVIHEIFLKHDWNFSTHRLLGHYCNLWQHFTRPTNIAKNKLLCVSVGVGVVRSTCDECAKALSGVPWGVEHSFKRSASLLLCHRVAVTSLLLPALELVTGAQ